jgi:hypothetical protein
MSSISYTNISAMNFQYPELDIASFENIAMMTAHPLTIVVDPSYCHRVVLADIDVSANIFKKLFFNTTFTSTTFNTLLGGFDDNRFGLLPAPNTLADANHTLDDAASTVVQYYADMARYISLLPPARRKYTTNHAFALQDEILDNIVLDLTEAYPAVLELFNTCSFINFNKEMVGLKTLNDIIPSATASCALDWGHVLELVRSEYDEVEGGVDQWVANPAKIAILKLTLVMKTTINMAAIGAAVDDLISTTEVVFRYRVNFSETVEFIAWDAARVAAVPVAANGPV